jgi:hypothetical protein
MWHTWVEDNCIEFSWEKLKKIEHLEDLDVHENIKLKRVLKK